MITKRTARAYHTHADRAPAYWMIGVLWRMLATGVQTGNAICLLDQLCSRGSGPTRHAHPQDEGLYVASGMVSFQAGGMELLATAGSFVSVPRHTEHSFVVDEDAVLINFYFPAGFDLWLMGSASPAARNELPPPGMDLPPYDLMVNLSNDYGGLPLTKERSTSPNPVAPALPKMTSRNTAETYWYNAGCWSILAEAASTGGSYSVFEAELPTGVAQSADIHDEADVAYYCFDGEIEFFVDDRTYSMCKGSFIFIPRGAVRGYRVLSPSARFLNIFTTPGFERMVRAFGTRASLVGLPPADWRQPAAPIEQLNDLHADLGIRRVAVPVRFSTSSVE